MTMIGHLQSWFDDHASGLSQRGVEVRIQHSVPEADKASAWVDIESVRSLGQVIVWESGETDFRVGDRDSGALKINQHRELAAAEELDTIIEEVIAAL